MRRCGDVAMPIAAVTALRHHAVPELIKNRVINRAVWISKEKKKKTLL
jgi:hypothetical protein